jgi:tRNA threonylcarbamoyladenosine biosynthesis protein TsaB
MAVILSIETSTSVCSVALHEEGKLMAVGELHRDQAHATHLAPLIEQVQTMAGIDLAQMSAVPVSAGPGSYTGLRIGTSTAKGLCFALNIPLLSVPTLQVMAHAVVSPILRDAWLCPMIDARRMEVFCQLFTAEGFAVGPVEAKIIDGSSFAEQLRDKPVIFFGNGASKCREVIKNTKAIFLENIYPSAAHMGMSAFDLFNRKEMVDLVRFEPFYLKEFFIRKPEEKVLNENKA